MPISGLVITLAEDPPWRTAALAALRDHPAIEVGEPTANRVPVVVDTADEEEDRRLWEWLHALPGVVLVVVAFIHFEQGPNPADEPCSSSGLAVESSLLSADFEP